MPIEPYSYNIKRQDCLLYYNKNTDRWSSISMNYPVSEAIELRRLILKNHPEWNDTIILEGIYYDTTKY